MFNVQQHAVSPEGTVPSSPGYAVRCLATSGACGAATVIACLMVGAAVGATFAVAVRANSFSERPQQEVLGASERPVRRAASNQKSVNSVTVEASSITTVGWGRTHHNKTIHGGKMSRSMVGRRSAGKRPCQC